MSNEIKTRSLLLVDDSSEDQAVFRQYLSTEPETKYLIVGTDNHEQALKLIHSNTFDCFILGQLASDQDRINILKEIKHGAVKNTDSVIMLLGAEKLETVLEAFQLGVVHYLLKEKISAESLQKAVTRCLENAERQARDEEQNKWETALLNSFNKGIIAIDINDEVKFINAPAEKLTGLTAPQALNQKITDLTKIFKDDIFNTSIVHNEFGNVIGSMLEFSEAIEPKHVKEEQLYLQEKIAYASVEAANKSKNEFIGLVSHELRNPLNSILGYTRLLQLQNSLSAQAQQMLKIIERSGKTQLHLINLLIDTSKMIDQKLKLEIAGFNFVEMVREVVEILRPVADSKAISMTFEIHNQVPEFFGDVERLHQVVMNLVSNAIKFTPAHGKIEIHQNQEGANLILQVTDSGKGFQSDFIPVMFERFAQKNENYQDVSGGLGLGLSLAQHLIQLHGGNIQAESPGLELGATFTVSLPIADVSDSVQNVGLDENDAILNTKLLAGTKLLVVENDEDSQELLRTILTNTGAEVTLANNARQAYEQLCTVEQPFGYNLMIADIGLPDEDGYSLMRKVRNLPHHSSIELPAIALTAYSRVEDRIHSLRAGFQVHISKPVDPLELITIIVALIKG